MNMKYFYTLLLLFVCTCFSSLQAQDVKFLMNNGDKLFADNYYRKALPFYEQVLAKEPDHAKALFKSGVCYLNRYSKGKAIVNIEKAYKLDEKVDKHIHYWLGRAYHLSYQFDKANEEYTIYAESLRKSDSRRKEVEQYIDQVGRSKKYVAKPSDFLVQNLGENVNSSFSEHSPVASLNDSVLLFTTRRTVIEGEKEEKDGEPFEDIYMSLRQADGTWSKPTNIGLNTSGHDASIQLFDNDNKLLLYRSSKDGDIYISQKEGDKWGDPKAFSDINSGDFEADAFVTADGNKVYFATNHYKKFGDMDIYYVTKNEDGSWGKHKELEGDINTDGDEDAPFITPDGKTLYFSSRGHDGMGGFDVFKSTLNSDGSWADPVNLGYPINTPDDDVYFYYASSDDRAYIASYREGGYGEKDLYAIMPIEKILMYGTVLEDKTGKKIEGAQIKYTSTKDVTNSSEDQETVQSGEYKDIEVLSYNVYKVEITQGGEVLLTDSVEVPLYSAKGSTLQKNYVIPFKGNPADTVTTADITKLADSTKTDPKSSIVETSQEAEKLEKELIVYFDLNSAVVSASSKKEILDLLKSYAKISTITIEGHTDSTGTDALNMRLSKSRAAVVAKYIATQNKAKSSSKGFGESTPMVPNDSPANQAKNRRVVVKVSGK